MGVDAKVVEEKLEEREEEKEVEDEERRRRRRTTVIKSNNPGQISKYMCKFGTESSTAHTFRE